MSIVPIIDRLNVLSIERGLISRFWLELTSSGLGQPVRVPMIVARGWEDGPVLGVTAVIHGNALNGLPIVRKLFQYLDLQTLKGTVVGIPVINMPGFLQQQRYFLDGSDLNQVMSGRRAGNISEMFTFRFIDRIISYLDYLVDVQTAEFGQMNTCYVRANMQQLRSALLARLLNTEAILHDPGEIGTLRQAAKEIGVETVTLIAGGPFAFNRM